MSKNFNDLRDMVRRIVVPAEIAGQKQHVLDTFAKAEAEMKRGAPGRATKELLRIFESVFGRLVREKETGSE